jgi:hypothetical protein
MYQGSRALADSGGTNGTIENAIERLELGTVNEAKRAFGCPRPSLTSAAHH